MKKIKQELLFEKYILPHYNGIYKYLCRLTEDEEIAIDLTQETMEKGWHNIDKLKSVTAAKAWIFRIATNEYKLYFRAQNAKKRLHVEVERYNEDGELILENISSDEPDPLEQIIRIGDRKAIIEALNNIDVLYRIILNLYLIEELTFNEISEIIEKPNSTVQYQYKKGIRLLKEEFDRIIEGRNNGEK